MSCLAGSPGSAGSRQGCRQGHKLFLLPLPAANDRANTQAGLETLQAGRNRQAKADRSSQEQAGMGRNRQKQVDRSRQKQAGRSKQAGRQEQKGGTGMQEGAGREVGAAGADKKAGRRAGRCWQHRPPPFTGR